MRLVLFTLALLVPSFCLAQCPPQVGIGDTVEFMFNTVGSDGAPITIGGTPAIEVYEEGSLTQITAGDTFNEDYDSVTGLHMVQLVCTTGNGYEAGKFYTVVIAGTTPTADSVSILGRVVGNFQCIQTATVDSNGRVAADAQEVSGDTTAADNLETAFQSTLTEPTGVPAANAPLWTQIQYLYNFGFRNKQVADINSSGTGEVRYYDDGDAVEFEKDVSTSGDATTTTEAGAAD